MVLKKPDRKAQPAKENCGKLPSAMYAHRRPELYGCVEYRPAISMNATFSPANNLPGNVSFLSQSGAMGEVILDYARSLNIGLSTFVSAGNRADVSPNDLVQYWEHDARHQSDIAFIWNRSVNPHNFMRITRRVSAKKTNHRGQERFRPSAGSRAASSHTGALATSETVTQALFKQAGILRVNGVEELFDVASLLSNQPLPKGRRLVIVTKRRRVPVFSPRMRLLTTVYCCRRFYRKH